MYAHDMHKTRQYKPNENQRILYTVRGILEFLYFWFESASTARLVTLTLVRWV